MTTTIHNCVQYIQHTAYTQQYNTLKHSFTTHSAWAYVCVYACIYITEWLKALCVLQHSLNDTHSYTYYGVVFVFSLTFRSPSIHNPRHVAACVCDVIVLNWIVGIFAVYSSMYHTSSVSTLLRRHSSTFVYVFTVFNCGLLWLLSYWLNAYTLRSNDSFKMHWTFFETSFFSIFLNACARIYTHSNQHARTRTSTRTHTIHTVFIWM